MKKYVKKPIPVEALQWTGDNPREILDFCKGAAVIREDEMAFRLGEGQYHLYIKTLEGNMYAKYGDYIIRGVNGEYYPCKCDIFKKTYEEIQESCEIEEKPPMTLEEAIAHCEDVVKKSTTKCACSKEHEQLRDWLQELKDLKSKYQYAMADIQNMKRRFQLERTEFICRANKEIIEDLLKIHDDFERIESAMDVAVIMDGIGLIKKNLEKLLDEEGCEKIEVKVGDDFDVNYHEAVVSLKNNDKEMSGKIGKIFQNGWELSGKVLRATKVGVCE